jgi:hypothetical protein
LARVKHTDLIEKGCIVVGIAASAMIIARVLGVSLFNSNYARSFATESCSSLCRKKKCSEYNSRCSKGCTACPKGGGTPPPTGGGTTGAPKSTWFFAGGSTEKMPNHRCSKSKCGQSTGSSSGGNRWETVKKDWMSSGGFEVVVYFQIPKGKMCNGGHIGLKHGGPEHTSPCDYKFDGDCCCWWDSGIRDDGTVYMEIERPHPNNSGTKTYGNIGSHLDTGKPIGVRWLIKKEGKGIRLMQWVDATSGKSQGNQWKKTYDILDTGQFMPSSYYSKIAKTQNVEIRMSDVNCSDVKMLYGPFTRKM